MIKINLLKIIVFFSISFSAIGNSNFQKHRTQLLAAGSDLSMISKQLRQKIREDVLRSEMPKMEHDLITRLAQHGLLIFDTSEDFKISDFAFTSIPFEKKANFITGFTELFDFKNNPKLLEQLNQILIIQKKNFLNLIYEFEEFALEVEKYEQQGLVQRVVLNDQIKYRFGDILNRTDLSIVRLRFLVFSLIQHIITTHESDENFEIKDNFQYIANYSKITNTEKRFSNILTHIESFFHNLVILKRDFELLQLDMNQMEIKKEFSYF